MARNSVGIVGAGIVGLAHAWLAAERGHRVTVFERAARAQGASIRNFGMVWPVGQPAGEPRHLAERSRLRWLQLQAEAGLWVNPCGSIHVAHRADEMTVLEEFSAHATTRDITCRLLTANEVLVRSAGVNPLGLLGGLFSPAELAVNPPAAIRSLPGWLSKRYDVEFRFETAVRHVDHDRTPVVLTSAGDRIAFERVVIGSGDDVRTLFPAELAKSGLKLCKLQMLATPPQPGGWRLGPHLASGLTLRHYANFQDCPGLPALRARIARESPELDRYGIHVMASQTDTGEVILGDSHEYDAEIEPYDKSTIDELMLRELRKVYALPNWTPARRWHGIYAKYPDGVCWMAEPLRRVHLVTGMGGSGMTMSFGIAERNWQEWEPL